MLGSIDDLRLVAQATTAKDLVNFLRAEVSFAPVMCFV